MGRTPLILLLLPSKPSSPANIEVLTISLKCALSHRIWSNSHVAIGISKRVPDFLMSDGAIFIMNFIGGISTSHWRNDARRRSLDSFTVLSASHIISIVGNDLLLSICIVISLHETQSGTMVLTSMLIWNSYINDCSCSKTVCEKNWQKQDKNGEDVAIMSLLSGRERILYRHDTYIMITTKSLSSDAVRRL